MGTATVTTITADQARRELREIEQKIGALQDARARSFAGLLSADDEAMLRQAEELTWLLSDR